MLAAAEVGMAGAALMPALHRNRELWALWSAECLDDGNQLPVETRASIVSLGLWVNRFTSDVIAGRETVDPLVAVNRSVMAALS
jgi:flagellar protein FlaF